MDARTRLLLLTDPYAGYRRTEAMTLSGNEITDASRAAGLEGDGLLNDSSFGIWEAATNLCTNGGFETNTTGWTTGGTNTLASSSAQAKFGAKSGLATYQDNATLADFGVTITNAPHTFSAWVYIPTAYDGGGVELRQTGFTVAASAVAASMGTRDAWQKLTLTATPGADVTGNVQINNTGAAPTAGRTINIDGVQFEAQPIATPYIETDGGTAARSAASVSAPASLLNETQGWIAMRARFGWGVAAEPGGGAGFVNFWTWADNTTNEMTLFYRDSTNALEFKRGNFGNPRASVALTHAAGDFATLIARWEPGTGAGNYAVSSNGAAWAVSGGTGTIQSVAADLQIGSSSIAAGREFDGDILWFACGTGTLTDADAATIHAFGDADRGLEAFPGNPTGFWSANTNIMEVQP